MQIKEMRNNFQKETFEPIGEIMVNIRKHQENIVKIIMYGNDINIIFNGDI